jgi:hypothetical protein
MEEDGDAAMLSRFWALHAAVLKRDGLEDRMRAGGVDEGLFDRSLAAAEGVLMARAALFRHLMEQGWRPPEVVVRDLVFDEVVLSSTGGAVRA